MVVRRQVLEDIKHIERKYGDVALAGALLFLAFSVYGALIQVSLHSHALVSAVAGLAQ
jgi:hypothetical protein